LYNEGHVLVNHTYSHGVTCFNSVKTIFEEIDRCDSAIGNAIGISGYKSYYFRPPMGLVTAGIRRALRRKNMIIVPVTYFNFDSETVPKTYNARTREIIYEIEKEKGGIIVLHDGYIRPYNIAESCYYSESHAANRTRVPLALEKIILYFKERDYTFTIPTINYNKQQLFLFQSHTQ
jgi:peptidoglycan/xylan/chitin deacetylase (PgdA/CDA1 family)